MSFKFCVCCSQRFNFNWNYLNEVQVIHCLLKPGVRYAAKVLSLVQDGVEGLPPLRMPKAQESQDKKHCLHHAKICSCKSC